VRNGEARTGIDWGERCPVAAVHGNAEHCRRGRREAAVGFGSGARELARKPEEWDVEACVKLVCARDRSPGACLWVLHVGGDVAADGHSGQPWHARGRTARKATAADTARVTRGERGSGDERRRRWQSGGQGRSSVLTAEQEAEEQSRRTEGRRGSEEEEERERSEGLVWKFQEVQGSLSKLKILTDIKIK
jgi:hypothetical protein